ncbi:MAG TPA: polysaccharide biosynthesis tyrosine autokinase [Chthonomonadaceae bacterium]|nr:polysaccharide biosynthesis tyrosine autokinase [Chthonomonadaceae bacterium]
MMQQKPPQANDISLRDYLDLLRRRKAVIIQTWLAILIVGVLITFMTRPMYRTTTRILVEGKTPVVTTADASNPLAPLFTPSTGYEVETQIEVLQSDDLQEKAFQAAHVPFDRSLKEMDRAVRLNVKQVGDTEVIEIAADSHRPQWALQLANAIPKVYLNYITGNRTEEVDTAKDYAKRRLEEEQRLLDEASAKLEAYRRQHKVRDNQVESSIQTNKAMAADADVSKAKQDVANAQAKLDTLLAVRRSLPEYIDNPIVQSNTTLIEAQKDKIADLEKQLAQKRVLFKDNSPEIQEILGQLQAAKARLAQIPERVTNQQRIVNPAIQTTEDKITDARAAVVAAQAALAEANHRAAAVDAELNRFNSSNIRQAQLQREVDQRTNNVALLSTNLANLELRRASVHKPVLTITPPTEIQKVAPRPVFNIVLATLLGLIFGVAFAMLQEFLDDRINSPDEARQISSVPALGYVPLVLREEAPLITDLRGGSTLESYRVLRSNVQFATVDRPICSLLVTSTIPGEGKSVTACNLAVAMALDGRRVILVDADLRRPTVHTKLGLPQQNAGLTNVLLGRRSLESALQETSIPGLRVLTAGSLPPNPAELLNSRAMHQLHEELKEHADVVIFDSPPCLATADAQVLSAMVDGVVYVVHLGETKKSALRHAFDLLRQAHANVLGVVFNKIDMTSKRDSYYYSQYGYYSSRGSELKPANGHHGRSRAEEMEELVKPNGNGLARPTEAVVNRVTEDSEERI